MKRPETRVEPTTHLYAGFVYTHSSATDLRAKFAQLREQMKPASTKNITALKRKAVK